MGGNVAPAASASSPADAHFDEMNRAIDTLRAFQLASEADLEFNLAKYGADDSVSILDDRLALFADIEAVADSDVSGTVRHELDKTLRKIGEHPNPALIVNLEKQLGSLYVTQRLIELAAAGGLSADSAAQLVISLGKRGIALPQETLNLVQDNSAARLRFERLQSLNNGVQELAKREPPSFVDLAKGVAVSAFHQAGDIVTHPARLIPSIEQAVENTLVVGGATVVGAGTAVGFGILTAGNPMAIGGGLLLGAPTGAELGKAASDLILGRSFNPDAIQEVGALTMGAGVTALASLSSLGALTTLGRTDVATRAVMGKLIFRGYVAESLLASRVDMVELEPDIDKVVDGRVIPSFRKDASMSLIYNYSKDPNVSWVSLISDDRPGVFEYGDVIYRTKNGQAIPREGLSTPNQIERTIVNNRGRFRFTTDFGSLGFWGAPNSLWSETPNVIEPFGPEEHGEGDLLVRSDALVPAKIPVHYEWSVGARVNLVSEGKLRLAKLFSSGDFDSFFGYGKLQKWRLNRYDAPVLDAFVKGGIEWVYARAYTKTDHPLTNGWAFTSSFGTFFQIGTEGKGRLTSDKGHRTPYTDATVSGGLTLFNIHGEVASPFFQLSKSYGSVNIVGSADLSFFAFGEAVNGGRVKAPEGWRTMAGRGVTCVGFGDGWNKYTWSVLIPPLRGGVNLSHKPPMKVLAGHVKDAAQSVADTALQQADRVKELLNDERQPSGTTL